MPKRKTADVTPEAPAAAEPRKKASTAKPKAAAAATHKHASTPKTSQVVAEAAANETPRVPTHAEIAALAYSYWEARGFQGGSSQDDWFHAERQLTKKD